MTWIMENAFLVWFSHFFLSDVDTAGQTRKCTGTSVTVKGLTVDAKVTACFHFSPRLFAEPKVDRDRDLVHIAQLLFTVLCLCYRFMKEGVAA